MHLLIGVNPVLFDSFYTAIQKIGDVKSLEITKVDKTNEYRQLNGQKASLEKTLSSLTELKARTGQISDFVTLHDKILEIEERLQKLGVDLGNFDSENEFCTVKLSLYEGAAEKKTGIFQRVKVAFEWSVSQFFIIVLTSLGLAVAIYIILLILDKLQVIATLINKTRE